MADIFGRSNSGFGGAFTSALAQLNISGDGSQIGKLLISNLQASYTQPISRVYEIASDKAYFIIGRPDGNGTIGSVFGPKQYSQVAYSKLADPCQTNNLELKASRNAACDASGAALGSGWGRRLTHVVLQNLGFQVNAQDMLINENLGFQFATMETVGN